MSPAVPSDVDGDHRMTRERKIARGGHARTAAFAVLLLAAAITLSLSSAGPSGATTSTSDGAAASASGADLALAKSAAPEPVEVGAELTYTLTVSNFGPEPAAEVALWDGLPASVRFRSADSSQGRCSEASGTVSCELGSIAVSGQATVTIVVEPQAEGTIENSALVLAATADPNPDNNSARVTSTVRAPPPPLRPNIVVILTDDEPYLDGRLIDFMPTTKALFETAGITFTNFRSQTPRCCPARATLLTGLRSAHHGVVDNDAGLFDPAETLATELDGLGYHTFLVGKYMNGYGSCDTSNCAPNVPPGWDRFVAFGDPAYYKYELWVDGVPERYGSEAGDYSTDVIAAKADELIRSAPSEQRIFAWIAPNAPHPPSTPAPRHKRKACASGKWTPPSWNEADVSDKPAYVQAAPLVPDKAAKTVKVCRALLGVDELVARVRQALVDTGRLDDTLLVYLGDNGVLRGEHRLIGKSAPYETHVPFFVAWPSEFPSGEVAEPVQDTDFAPTLCKLLGCTLGPFPTGQDAPDGISFAALLSDHSGTLGRDALLEELPASVGDIPAWQALRTNDGRWHYVEYVTGERELYERTIDPWELENKANDPGYADVVAELHAKLEDMAGS